MMNKFLLDTNVLIHKIRESHIWAHIESVHFKKGVNNNGFISQVTVGELLAFAYENKWGSNRRKKLKETIGLFERLAIDDNKTLKAYARISAYSRNRHKSLKLPKHFPAKDMGKNDIWIAATAVAIEAPLISTDKDFEHLDGVFLDFIYIDQDKISNPAAHV